MGKSWGRAEEERGGLAAPRDTLATPGAPLGTLERPGSAEGAWPALGGDARRGASAASAALLPAEGAA